MSSAERLATTSVDAELFWKVLQDDIESDDRKWGRKGSITHKRKIHKCVIQKSMQTDENNQAEMHPFQPCPSTNIARYHIKRKEKNTPTLDFQNELI